MLQTFKDKDGYKMRIMKEAKLNEDFVELGEFDNLDKSIIEIASMFKDWYKHTKSSYEDEDAKKEGYKSVKDMVESCKKEIIMYFEGSFLGRTKSQK